MSKGLEALEQFRNRQQGVNVYADELLDIIEKELKALEIIKEKNVDTRFFRGARNADEYNNHCGNELIWKKITQEEFDLLKELSL